MTWLPGYLTDFTWKELVSTMNSPGYQLKTTGGSGWRFFKGDEPAFMLYEPHPLKVLKAYRLRG
jgi:hypothetical protein